MTFGEFLDRARAHDTLRGDFILDARRDRTFPRDCASEGALRHYMTARGACCEAVESGRRFWREYQRFLGGRA